jgi:hypothetical protein
MQWRDRGPAGAHSDGHRQSGRLVGEDEKHVNHDWSSSGIDWRNESMDDEMAEDWLRASHHPEDASSIEVSDRVLELVESDLDPPRGWRITKRLIESARTDDEFYRIGSDVLSQVVENHEGLVGEELAELLRSDARYQRAVKGQARHALVDFVRRSGLSTYC